MKLNMTVREQRTLGIVAVLGAGILWMYLTYIVGPLMREAGELGRQVRTAREELKLLQTATANESALKTQHQQLQETVASLRKLLPAEEELPKVIELISDMAGQSQVKIQTIFPQRPLAETSAATQKDAAPPPPLVYRDVLIQIDALAGFHQLGTFLSLVETGDTPMQVSSLKISSDPKDRRLQVKLLVQSYFATSGNVSLIQGKR